ncbi:MAG: sel1 repeat family protein [Pseudomonas sp.]|jgi:TPR repeat protein|nr:sel1 repeat family protein [Pseudomonas sp.]MDD2222469.1 sel1 repeat family protein [Pseudomonas sp.]MDY0414593.1 sel1 repeat family protein [Pseudomonas sp.]NLO53453.1 sel1 repeat family protein [Gammaproteobacteria bacterium]
MLFSKLRAQIGYAVARKLFNQRWAVENKRIWQWMQERFARMSSYDDVSARAFYGHVLLHRGQGLAAKNEGLRLLRLAAEAGDAKSAYQLGLQSLTGSLNQPADALQAAHWWELAGRAGHPLALQRLLQLYEQGGPQLPASAEDALRIKQQLAIVQGLA